MCKSLEKMGASCQENNVISLCLVSLPYGFGQMSKHNTNVLCKFFRFLSFLLAWRIKSIWLEALFYHFLPSDFKSKCLIIKMCAAFL